MVNNMNRTITRNELETLLERARASFPHDACLTCECFLGYLVQLGLDAGEEVQRLFDEMDIDRERTHSCMGCDPCPPADLFAGYLQQRGQ
jgi:hypothetical protein